MTAVSSPTAKAAKAANNIPPEAWKPALMKKPIGIFAYGLF